MNRLPLNGTDRLRGLCWEHERCIGPMRAAAAVWEASGGVPIAWDARPLSAFNDQQIAELVATYDLLFVDHPHVGAAAHDGALVPLDGLLDATLLDELAAGAVGPSHDAYRYDGRQWALATDAACQVSVVREDLLGSAPPATWEAVLALAADRPRAVALPLAGADALCSLLSVQAGLGRPLDPAAGRWFDAEALAMLAALVVHAHPASHGTAPPALLDAMATGDEIAYIPLCFGYVTHARRLRFVDVPGVRGAILGGAGLAVSAATPAAQAAADFAAWVSSGPVQRDVVAPAGGQPGQAAAWDDPALDAAAGLFFSGTRATIESAWVRPREPWWPALHRAAGERLAAGLRRGGDPAALAASLNDLVPDLQETAS